MSYANNEERHTCDECSQLCFYELHLIEEELEEYYVCNECHSLWLEKQGIEDLRKVG